jgi:2-polyprenyl-3-methyl-5-hydroxy-6-metoxy-1,4-benzoquinol methylase
MNNLLLHAKNLHKSTPPDWYYQSLRKDLLQYIWHKRRFEEISKLMEKVNGKILDIGCADGVFSKVVLDKTGAKKLIGIDVLETSVNWANKHWKNTGRMNFIVGNAHCLKFDGESFDAVVSLEMLEHVFYPIKVLKEIKRVLKRRGYAVFLVPTDNILFRAIWFLWLHFYPRGWVWKETHIQSYRNDYLPKLCKKAGFEIEDNKKFNLGMLQVVKVRKV